MDHGNRSVNILTRLGLGRNSTICRNRSVSRPVSVTCVESQTLNITAFVDAHIAMSRRYVSKPLGHCKSTSETIHEVWGLQPKIYRRLVSCGVSFKSTTIAQMLDECGQATGTGR